MLIARHGMHRVSTVRRKSTVSMVNMRHSLCITNLKISRSKPWTVQGPEIRKMDVEKVPGNASLGTDFIADPVTLCMTHTEIISIKRLRPCPMRDRNGNLEYEKWY